MVLRCSGYHFLLLGSTGSKQLLWTSQDARSSSCASRHAHADAASEAAQGQQAPTQRAAALHNAVLIEKKVSRAGMQPSSSNTP